MRRIEFIAPVDAMRGNLSGSQKLRYAENNNPAWNAPAGVSKARNYTPRYIGNKRFTGAKGFSVRTVHVINNTPATKKAQALLGGSASCYNQAIRSLMIISNLQQAFIIAKTEDPSLTMRKWLQPKLYAMLENKRPSLSINDGTTTVVINNPWVQGGTGTDLPIPAADLVKFWPYLSKNGSMFRVEFEDGRIKEGVYFLGMTFGQLIESNINVLGLAVQTIPGDAQAVTIEGDYLCAPHGEEWVVFGPDQDITGPLYKAFAELPA